MCDPEVAKNASMNWSPEDPLNHNDSERPFSPPPVSEHSASIPSPEQAPPRYPLEAVASTARHSTHFPPGHLPPLEPRPSSPVTLPSFNTLESIIRRGSPPARDPDHMTRHPQNGPTSSGHHRKPWKSENMLEPSAGSTLPGQQLNVPAPSLPPGYPGTRLLLGDTQRKSRVETQIKQLITLESNGERVTKYHYIHVPQSASVKRYKMPPKNVPPSAILTLEALAIPSSYPAVQAFCCRTCYCREAKRKPEAYPESLPHKFSPIDFACSEYLEFVSGTAIVPFRIICYSRHHSEKEGFNVRLILRNQQGDVIAAVQTTPIMITDDRKAVKRSIAAAEANGATLGLPADRKRSSRDLDLEDEIMPRHIRQRTADYVPPTSRDYPSAGPSSNPFKSGPGHSQPGLYTQPGVLHPSLAPTVAQPASIDGVYPNKGPVKGGIQVAVTGVNLTAKTALLFGGILVVDKIYKCDRLIICVLPAAPSPGCVAVSLAGAPTSPKSQFPTFTYESEGTNDSGMISTALTVMAYWETGKWENPTDVATRVLASNSSEKRFFKDEKAVYDQNASHVRFSPTGH